MSVHVRYFTGEFEHAIDAVNRLVIPAKWRMGKSEEFFLLVRDQGSLAVLTREELGKIIQAIDSAPNLSNREKRDRKQLFSTAVQVTCDKQGRFTMDVRLLKQAGLKKAVVFVGMLERFEIWNPEAWAKRHGEIAATRGATLEELGI